MPSRLSRFTDRPIALSERAVSGNPAPAVKKGNGGYADRMIIAIHGLRGTLIIRTDDFSMFSTRCTVLSRS